MAGGDAPFRAVNIKESPTGNLGQWQAHSFGIVNVSGNIAEVSRATLPSFAHSWHVPVAARDMSPTVTTTKGGNVMHTQSFQYSPTSFCRSNSVNVPFRTTTARDAVPAQLQVPVSSDSMLIHPFSQPSNGSGASNILSNMNGRTEAPCKSFAEVQLSTRLLTGACYNNGLSESCLSPKDNFLCSTQYVTAGVCAGNSPEDPT